MSRPGHRRRPLLAALFVVAVTLVAARPVAAWFLFRGASAAVGERALPRGFTVITSGARDGVVVHALDLPALPQAWTVVHFHNNRDTAGDGADLARALHERGFGVLLVEYRGYGLSGGGEPSEAGFYADAESALDGLADRGVPPGRVVLWGTSLGTGVAAEMARRARGAALVLVAPYTSIPAVVLAAAPFAPAELLFSDRFDTLGKAAQIRVPTLIVHGDADEVVPFWMGQGLASTIVGARLMHVVEGHHGDLFVRDRERILDALDSLVRGGVPAG